MFPFAMIDSRLGSSGSLIPTYSSANYLQGTVAGGGDSIVVQGTNLSGVTITLGGNACTVTASSPTSATFDLPAHAAGLATLVLTNAYGNDTRTNLFEYWNPAVLTATANYVPSYTSPSWTNGGSVADTLIAHVVAPATGAAVMGKTAAQFNGSTHAFTTTTNNAAQFITTTNLTCIVLCNPAASTAAATDYYDDPALFADTVGNFGLVYTSSGFRAGIFAAATKQTAHVTAATGSWYMAAMRNDGSDVKLRVNSTDATPVASGTIAGLGTPFYGKNYTGAKFFQGDVLALVQYQSAISDANLEKHRLYFKQLHGLTL